MHISYPKKKAKTEKKSNELTRLQLMEEAKLPKLRRELSKWCRRYTHDLISYADNCICIHNYQLQILLIWPIDFKSAKCGIYQEWKAVDIESLVIVSANTIGNSGTVVVIPAYTSLAFSAVVRSFWLESLAKFANFNKRIPLCQIMIWDLSFLHKTHYCAALIKRTQNQDP